MKRVEPNRNVYVGHRYVPLLVGEWDKSIQYEGLSIVTYKGASYTSKKRTPPGIDIENEEYWVLTGNYNAQIEYYRKDVNDYKDTVDEYKTSTDEEISNINDEISDFKEDTDNRFNDFKEDTDNRFDEITEETDNRFNDLNLIVKSNGNDDTSALQEAIDIQDNLGGGNIYLPDNQYYYSENIHVKEGVKISGNERTQLNCTVNHSAKIILYNTVQIDNLTINIPENFNDSAILLSNEFLNSVDRREKSSSSVKTFIEKIKMFTPFNPSTLDKVAIEFFATRSDVANATAAGYWGVSFLDSYIDGFNVPIHFNTELTGWVNANIIKNVTVYNFVNAVKVSKSSESLGVDSNELELIVQTSETTRDIFVDGVSSNNYSGCQIWDMHSYTESRTGNAIVKNIVNGSQYPKERYASYLLRKKYHLIGRFRSFSSMVSHVKLNFNAYGNYDTDFHIRGNDEKIEIRHKGNVRYSNDIKFFKRVLSSGETELYVYNNLDTEIEANVFIDSFRSFYPSPIVYYDEVENLIELTNTEVFHPSPRGMYTNGENENGAWVKYDDGTMICRVRRESELIPNEATGSIFRSSGGEKWTFPQPFISGSHLNVSIETTNANRWASITSTPTPEECNYNIMSSLEGESKSNVFIMAVGYWK